MLLGQDGRNVVKLGESGGRRVIVLLVLGAAWAAACHSRSDPERVLEAYVSAVRENRCADARKLLSARTNYALDALRIEPQHPQSPIPLDEYYCSRWAFADCKSGKMTLISQNGDTATISMPCGRTQDSIFPGFSSPFLKYEPRTIELVREDGEWRFIDPYVIRIVEVREKEDRMRKEALARQERIRRERSAVPDPYGSGR